MATSPVYFGAVKQAVQTLVNADGTTLKDLAVAGSSGSKVFAPILTSNDTTSRVVDFWVYNGSTAYLLGSASVSNGAGIAGVASVGGFDLIPRLPVDNDGNKFLYLPSGYKLQISAEVAITAAKTLYATASQEDF